MSVVPKGTIVSEEKKVVILKLKGLGLSIRQIAGQTRLSSTAVKDVVRKGKG